MTTISDAKIITPIFHWSNGRLVDVEYKAEFDDNVIGFFPNHNAAEEGLNDYVLGLLEAGLIGGPDYPEPDAIPGADPAPGRAYHFTPAQLDTLLNSTIAMFIEWRDVHGRDEESAGFLAVAEMVDGLDADRELAACDPTERLRVQLVP